MIAVMSGLFLVALDQTIISTALAQITEDFNSFSSLGLIVTAYLLTSTVTVPIAGRMSDLFGRKKVLLVGVAIFTTASLLSGAAGSIEQLILFRGIQGIGGGIIVANAFTIVGDLFDPRERGRWQGFVGGVFGIASVVGPLLGGFLTDEQFILGFTTSWRWAFYINIPIGIVAVLMIIRYCPAIKNDRKPVVDYYGAVAIAIMLAAIVLAVDSTETVFQSLIDQGIALGVVQTTLFAVAALAAAGFIFAEARAEQPIIPLSFFKNRNYTSVIIAVLLFGAAFLGAVLYLTQFNRQVFGAGATEAGLMLLPMIGGMVTTSIVIGQVVSRTGVYKRYILIGFSMATAGVLALSTLTPTSPYWHEAIMMLLVGIGLGAGMPIMNLIVQNEFDQKDLGAATSSVQLSRGLGATVGIAILTAILTTGVTNGIGDIKNTEYIQAVQASPAGTMIEGEVDADVVLQLNAKEDEIKEQAFTSINEMTVSDETKDVMRNDFVEAQSDFSRRVEYAFSDSLSTLFKVSGGLMLVAIISIGFLKPKELQIDN